MEVTDEADRDTTGDPEDAIWRSIWGMAERAIKPEDAATILGVWSRTFRRQINSFAI
jgi:hypothetical protein